MFTLGMVSFKVRTIHRVRTFHGSETPSCTFFQIFTRRVLFLVDMVMKKIIDAKRPPRPKGKKLELSDEFWEITQSPLAYEMGKDLRWRHSSSFWRGLPQISPCPDNSPNSTRTLKTISKTSAVFEYGDDALFGMREDETVVIEVFDRVGFLVRHLVPLYRLRSTFVSGPKLFVG